MTTTSLGDPLVGALLGGRYQILQRLARGGMATVYRATDMRLSRVVAVKVMHEGLGEDDDFTRKFDREARSAAKLSHPNVVSVFDQGHDGGRPYIVMEYVAGCTLRNLIAQDAPMAPERALELIDLMLSALAAAHGGGLVHRDIKPENVLLSDRGQLKVADFGLARAVTSQTATATQGVLIGTVSYLPPELVLHGKADTRSDIYSTGVVLFELLTGSKPYTGETPIQVAYAHVHNQVPAPSTRLDTSWQTSREAIPPYLDALVRAATQREPDRRPGDARQFQLMVRKAGRALAAGVMDDPALTAEFSRGFIDLGGAQTAWGTARPAPVSHPISPMSALSPHSPVSPPGAHHQAPHRSTSHQPAQSQRASQHPPAAPPTRHQPAVRRTPPGTRHERTCRPDAAGRRRPSNGDLASATGRRGAAGGHLVEHHHQPPPETIRRRRLLPLIALVLATIVATTAWWFLDGRFVATPALPGLTEVDAERAAGEQGLSLRIDQAYSETAPAGTVVATRPLPGADVTRGGTITAIVSRGPERFAMPPVVSLTKDAATVALAEHNLAVGTVNEDWHEDIEPGLVSASSVEPGTQLRRDARVDLTLSKGARPIGIANQVGRPAKDAQATLERAGFAVVVKTANSAQVAEGSIISQQPGGGVGHRGDTVTVVRSLGPVMVKVPEVKAMRTPEAVEALTRAGFRIDTRPGENHLGLGYALRTDPSSGQEAAQGATITLFEI